MNTRMFRPKVSNWYGRGVLDGIEIHLVPLLRRDLAGRTHAARRVDGLLVDDVEHDLRIDVAAEGAGAGLGIGVIGGLLEPGDGVDGIAVIDRISAGV